MKQISMGGVYLDHVEACFEGTARSRCMRYGHPFELGSPHRRRNMPAIGEGQR